MRLRAAEFQRHDLRRFAPDSLLRFDANDHRHGHHNDKHLDHDDANRLHRDVPVALERLGLAVPLHELPVVLHVRLGSHLCRLGDDRNGGDAVREYDDHYHDDNHDDNHDNDNDCLRRL